MTEPHLHDVVGGIVVAGALQTHRAQERDQPRRGASAHNNNLFSIIYPASVLYSKVQYPADNKYS